MSEYNTNIPETKAPNKTPWDALTESYPSILDDASEGSGAKPEIDDPYAILDNIDPNTGLEDIDQAYHSGYDAFRGDVPSGDKDYDPYFDTPEVPPLVAGELSVLVAFSRENVADRSDDDPNKVGDLRALSLLEDLLGDGRKPNNYLSTDDPETYLRREVLELQGRVGYTSEAIEYTGYDGENYYVARRALSVLSAFKQDPGMARAVDVIGNTAKLNPEMNERAFADMRYLTKDQLSLLRDKS